MKRAASGYGSSESASATAALKLAPSCRDSYRRHNPYRPAWSDWSYSALLMSDDANGAM
jgi:hypothetical protein